MVQTVILKKKLADRLGEGRNGHYCFARYIGEFTEEAANGPVIHSVIIECSAKRFKVAEIDKLVGTATTLECNVSLDVRSYNNDYFQEVNVYIRNREYQIEREY